MSCQETAGFLFRHKCTQQVENACADCDKGICAKHTKRVGEADLCVACARLQLDKQAQNDGGGRVRRKRRGSYGRYDDDPYFYGYSSYDGYGYYGRGSWGHDHYARTRSDYDGDDFTAADAGSLQVEADEPFESEMGAS